MTKTKMVAFNKAVLDSLRENHPDVANLLNSRGDSLGWWNNIAYWYTQSVKPEQAASMLVNMNK